ncbi:hypothetical protein [Bradyrhizobium sp. HKCCYLS20291]
MASWLELLFNIIGYGGFVVLASHHPAHAVADPGQKRVLDETDLSERV